MVTFDPSCCYSKRNCLFSCSTAIRGIRLLGRGKGLWCMEAASYFPFRFIAHKCTPPWAALVPDAQQIHQHRWCLVIGPLPRKLRSSCSGHIPDGSQVQWSQKLHTKVDQVEKSSLLSLVTHILPDFLITSHPNS